MQRRAVGHSGLQVSRLGLGTLTWGRETRLEDARPLLRNFVDAGGSLVDTAAAYAAGDAERMIGRMLRAGDVDRDDLVLATKAGFGIRDGVRVVDTSRTTLLSDLDVYKRQASRSMALAASAREPLLGTATFSSPLAAIGPPFHKYS